MLDCLALVTFLGYSQTLFPNRYHTTDLSGTTLEVRTCERGLAAYGRLHTSGLFAGGITYGITARVNDVVTVSLSPHVGISYVDHPVRELPQRTQFDVGGQVGVWYKNVFVGAQYSHQSNAGMTQPNIGHDQIIGQVGYRWKN